MEKKTLSAKEKMFVDLIALLVFLDVDQELTDKVIEDVRGKLKK